MDSKDNFINSIICAAVILNIVFFSFIMIYSLPPYPYPYPYNPYVIPQTFYVGTGDGPKTIDPIDSWDSTSNHIIGQVAECLWWYDVTDPDLPLEGLLATAWKYSASNLILDVHIREFVYFHDGSLLDATVVKWNLDRINYFINASGTLPPTTVSAVPASLYFLPDGRSIINRSEVLDDYVVRIYLNDVFASFIPLMSYTSSAMISMISHSATEYIDLTTGDLVGTGPYMYDFYRTDIEVRFTRFDRYWGTNPYFEMLIFLIISNSATRCQAMLGHSVDMIFSYDPCLCCDLENDPFTTIVDTGPDLIYWYMAFDNYRINVTWREAISKANNYTYIIEEIRMGSAVRGPPCVPSGMPGYNASTTVAQQNIPEARSIMQRMGFGTGWDVGSQIGDIFAPGAHEINWSEATFFIDAFGHPLDVNYHIGSGMNRKLNDLLYYNLDKIGISSFETIREWDQFIDDGENGLLKGIWYAGRKPEYIDAFNMLDPLFNPNSSSNFCNLTDPQVLKWLAAAAIETNITKRDELFGNLQYRLYEVLYVHMPLWATKTSTIHGIDIQGYQYNQLDIFLTWPIYREAL